jgi:hypothetical protein
MTLSFPGSATDGHALLRGSPEATGFELRVAQTLDFLRQKPEIAAVLRDQRPTEAEDGSELTVQRPGTGAA